MNELLIIPIAYAIGVPIALAIKNGRERVYLAKLGKEEREGAALREVQEKERRGAYVLDVVRRAYMSLRKQKARGHGPWLASILEKGKEGRGVPAAVAVTALEWTARELEGRGFDLSGLALAIEELKAL